MDFKEYLIKKEKTPREIFLTVLIYLAATVLAVIGVMCMLFVGGLGGIMMLLIVGVYYGAYILSSRFNKEFEYVQTDEYFDVDVIFNKSRRKRIASFSAKSMEIMANEKDSLHNHILKGDFDKVIDATTGKKDEEIYFVVFNKNGRNLLKIQPPEALVKEMHRYAPSKVHLKKD